MSGNLINRIGDRAVYVQISEILEEEIRSLFNPGDALPTENDLADRFSVNRHTVRRAIDELVSQGILERKHGKGTFVLAQINYSIGSGTRFTENLNSLGRNSCSCVLRKLVIPAVSGVAKRLKITAGSPVIWIETLRTVDDQPFCIISHFLPNEGYEEVLQAYDGGSLHQFLDSRFGIKLCRTESLITSVLPQGEDASYLKMPAHQPVLRTKSVNINSKTNQPVEYALTRFRADRTELKIEP